MTKFICIGLNGNESDDEIRQEALRYINGEYAETICRKCGSYTSGPQYSIRDAEILDVCKDCFEK